MTFDCDTDAQDEVLGPLVRVIEEAADDAPWALIGGSGLRLQRAPTASPNLEFMAPGSTVEALAEMLQLTARWERGGRLAATRLHFLRHGVPVFVFADPVFHGRYDSLKPMEIPSLWDARVPARSGTVQVLCTPPEWELLLAVVLGMADRIREIRQHLRKQGFDSRLIVRLLREGRVDRETEEAVWSVLERDN
ncbi:MAG: hypothetical protein O3A10_06960 [Chloroflexi bacterium]|nr:hypothetical protein [Chloroflexota bacterium]MDA1146044.1 hypothetical protein [Chloroflexota bacterium]